MRYVKAKWEKSQRDLAYRIYITDSLYAFGQGKVMSERFINLIKSEESDGRSGDEVAADVINRLGLKVKEDGCI